MISYHPGFSPKRALKFQLWGFLSFVLLPALGSLLLTQSALASETPAWPFTPRTRPAIPEVKDTTWAKNPIDVFILARLEHAGIRPNPPADRLTLLRRLTFDLTGLTPTLEESEAFLTDRSPDAYARVVERLLGSPHFGERWAQHWLDVVRYADSDGFKSDRVRPNAYRYRDWVIRAFNGDLSYDQFLRYQIAGDELAPGSPDALIATGFYRLPPEESTAGDFSQVRQDLLDDVTDNVGLTFLGLTVGCARCHDHKFDPISQKDYFRLQAFFAPLIQRNDLNIATSAEALEHHKQLARWEEATRGIRAEMEALVQAPREEIRKELILAYDEATQNAFRTDPDKRTPLQQQLIALASKQLNTRGSVAFRRLKGDKRTRYNELRDKLASFDNFYPAPLPGVMAATDLGPVGPPTRRLLGGNIGRPKEELKPAFPEIFHAALPNIHPPATHPWSTGRRLALAEWLSRPDHPLTARVMVNRLWHHYTGRGLVATPNDFGVMGSKPTHPELMDYLADELVHHDWSLKAVHRLIVTSAAYRQSSRPEMNADMLRAAKADPNNDLLWHARVRRREGEAIRDAILQASKRLDQRFFGIPARPELPAALADDSSAWYPDPRPEDRRRRSIYVLAMRNLTLPLFASFDQPDRHNSCPARARTTTAPQALALLNGEFALTEARHAAHQLLAELGPDDHKLVRAIYLRILGRPAGSPEARAAELFLAHQASLMGDKQAHVEAIADLCHALMNSAEFLHVD